MNNQQDTSGLSGSELNSANQANTLKQVSGYGAIANGVGQMIGGSTGKAISTTANYATTGATIGSVIPGIGTVAGAIVGGVVGLVSSLFGGSGKSESQNQSDATAVASSVKSMAESGNSTAQHLMKLSNYDTYNLSNLDSRTITGTNLSSSLLNRGYKADYSLIKVDSSGKGTELTDQLTYLGKIETAINKFANASVVQTLSDIDYKYAEIEAKIGATADTAKAKIDEIFTSVLGLSADTVGTAISSAFSSYSGFSSAGEKAATTISDSLITSIQNMGLSSTISDIITPLYEEALTPYLTKITSGIKLTVADYSEISSVISSLKTSTTETVNAIYDLYKESGMLTSAQQSATASTNNLTVATTELGTAATTTATAETTVATTTTATTTTATTTATAETTSAAKTITDAVAQAVSEASSQITTIVKDAISATSTSIIDTNTTNVADLIDALKSTVTSLNNSTQSLTSANEALNKSTIDNTVKTAQNSLLAYQSNMWVTQSTSSISGRGSMALQQSFVAQLAQDALSSDLNVRASGLQGLSGAVTQYSTTARGLSTDPMEFAREVARESRLISDAAAGEGNKDATLKEVKDVLVAVQKSISDGNEVAIDIRRSIKDFQINGIMTTVV